MPENGGGGVGIFFSIFFFTDRRQYRRTYVVAM